MKAKTDKYDADIAHAALAGDEKAQRKLKAYNIGDIRATEAVYDRLRPYMSKHPHIAMFTGDEWGCPNCGYQNLSNNRQGEARTFVQAYRQYQCVKCGTWIRGNRKLQSPVQTRHSK